MITYRVNMICLNGRSRRPIIGHLDSFTAGDPEIVANPRQVPRHAAPRGTRYRQLEAERSSVCRIWHRTSLIFVCPCGARIFSTDAPLSMSSCTSFGNTFPSYAYQHFSWLPYSCSPLGPIDPAGHIQADFAVADFQEDSRGSSSSLNEVGIFPVSPESAEVLAVRRRSRN